MQTLTKILRGAAAAALLACAASCEQPAAPPSVALAPQSLGALHDVSDRFLSYNVEMVEVTGGRFWRPYDAPEGEDAYEYRPPIDLSNARLRRLAAALGPSYMRVSGSWANKTFFADTDTPPETPPESFDSVLTRDQWRAVVEFSQAVDAPIVTSFAASAGVRDAQGVWTPVNADPLLRYTQSLGGVIAAAEYVNEPSQVDLTGAPEDYTVAQYGPDFDAFRAWIKAASPQTVVLGPGTVYMPEPVATLQRTLRGPIFGAEELMAASETAPDAISFHYYGASSQRCNVPFATPGEDSARKHSWLARIDDFIPRYAALRDRYAPGTQLWLTETAETACGGNPWAATFADTFRFTDQIARSARQGVAVYMHNTLAASDYAILDEHSFAPRPSYWSALLWRTFMGARVLDTGAEAAGQHVYAHCLRGVPGGVVMVAINLSDDSASLTAPIGGALYALTQGANPTEAALNGETLALGAEDALPALNGRAFASGAVELAPASVNYLVFADAQNSACQ